MPGRLKFLINKIYISESILTYQINSYGKKMRLFGEDFVKNNKDNFYLIIDNRKKNFCEFYNPIKYNMLDYLKVKLIQKKFIKNMSFMFYKSNLSSQRL